MRLTETSAQGTLERSVTKLTPRIEVQNDLMPTDLNTHLMKCVLNHPNIQNLMEDLLKTEILESIIL